MYENPWFYVAILALFLIGVTKSGFGSGVGLIIVPMTALAMGHGAFPGRGEAAALGLLLPLLVVGDFISIYQHRAYFKSDPASNQPAVSYSTRRIMKLMLPGTVLGVLIGSLILWWFSKQEKMVASLMRMEIGAESVLLVGLHWWRQWKGVQTKLMPEPARGTLTGTFAGAAGIAPILAGRRRAVPKSRSRTGDAPMYRVLVAMAVAIISLAAAGSIFGVAGLLAPWRRAPSPAVPLSLSFGLGALRYPIGRFGSAGPGLFPLMVSCLLLLIGVITVVRSYFVEHERLGFQAKNIAIIVASLCGFALVSQFVNMTVGIAFMVFCASFAGTSYSVMRNLKVAAGLIAVAFAFQKLLGLNLPLY